MIAVIDYGIGNLFSITRSLDHLGYDTVITGEPEVLKSANGIILPGVGAFGDAMDKLKATGLVPLLTELKEKKPFLGICLGMQLLFEQSEEYGLHEGLGFLKGTVVSLEGKTKGLKIPHMGWNSLHIIRQCPILADTKEGDYVYFVHSYCASQCESSLCAVSDYGFSVPAVVADGSVYGCQFHPEKSGEAGLRILNAFARLTKENKA